MKKVFISYDYDEDRDYKNTLLMWSKNQSAYFSNFSFEDGSTDVSINSFDEAAIKRAISRRMNQCDVFLLLVGEKTHKSSWCNWEIEKAKELGLILVAVKISYSNTSPTGIYNAGATWAKSFTYQAISSALE
ncbi:TIR domain-containing protein [Paenibacillus sp. FSL L8-0340]|uniref:TIR domain-containing protein n=1 Tax=Paenibacillus sp. FSL L8-0340 TaxID=2954685 RepID=UPI00315867BA